MSLLAIVRHGQSIWNLENKFTGDVDVDLSEQGRQEARDSGKKLISIGFDACFTSVLKRAIHTLEIILQELGATNLPIYKSPALNERYYGKLQGLNKEETAKRYGLEQVAIWRRSFDEAPPEGESLRQTQERVLAYYKKAIVPLLVRGKNVLIVAHGNSLRALMMHLEHVEPANISKVEIATGKPRVYTLDEDLRVVSVEDK